MRAALNVVETAGADVQLCKPDPIFIGKHLFINQLLRYQENT